MTVVSPPARTITVRVPTVDAAHIPSAPSYLVGKPVTDLKVGLRTEGQWRSWLIIVREWERALAEAGARPDVVKTGERVGAQGEQTRALVEGWTGRVDCAIVGLGTCGSCTSWSVRDAISVEAAGKPVLVVVTTEFEVHGRTIATHLGHEDIKFLVLPYPLETRPEDELVAMAARYFPDALATLGVTRD
jgi:hypothetical protein